MAESLDEALDEVDRLRQKLVLTQLEVEHLKRKHEGLVAALRRIDFEDRQFREKASRLGSPKPPAILGQIARDALNPANKDS